MACNSKFIFEDIMKFFLNTVNLQNKCSNTDSSTGVRPVGTIGADISHTPSTPTRRKFDLKCGMATREAFGKALAKLLQFEGDLSRSPHGQSSIPANSPKVHRSFPRFFDLDLI